MKKVLLLLTMALSVWLLTASVSGCGGSGTTGVLPTPNPTPTPTPTPTALTPTFASLRADGTTIWRPVQMTPRQLQTARRRAKTAHAASPQGAIIVHPDLVNIYIWPSRINNSGFFEWGSERKITNIGGGYTSVHLSLNKSSIVFSAIVNGFNQVFAGTVPAEGKTLEEPAQLTTYPEQHWVPHISADGSQVVFTKFDPSSNGDVVCVIDNAAGAVENCLDFSSTTPVLKGADLWHASWTPDGKIVFEAWDGPLPSDEIFLVNADGSGLTQITNNAGTKNYDECPSVSKDGIWLAVDTWNDTTKHYDIEEINLNTKERSTFVSGQALLADAWDPLFTEEIVWVSKRPPDRNEGLYVFTLGPMRITDDTFANYFENSISPR